jgi:hypothetical protein
MGGMREKNKGSKLLIIEGYQNETQDFEPPSPWGGIREKNQGSKQTPPLENS